jgi:hypothetical protein
MTAPFLTLDARATNNRSRELKNQVFVFLAVIANTLGNFLLSVGMHPIQLKRPCSRDVGTPLGR